MMKKIGIAALILVGIGVLLVTTKLGSYTGTAIGKVRTAVGNQVPMEFEVERLRHEVSQLVPDMNKNLRIIAEEMVAIENLREEIASTKANLDKQKAVLLKTTDDLESGATKVAYRGREYAREKVSEFVSKDLAAYRRCEGELKSKENLLEAKEQSLEAAREQLASMKEQRRELEVQIAQLEAEMKTVRLAQTRSKYQFDDSRLSQIKSSLAELRSRLQVEKTELQLRGEFGGDVAAPEKPVRPSSDVAREVRQYFNEVKVAEQK